MVNRLRWVDEGEMAALRFKADSLARLAFGPRRGVLYHPLEVLVR